jgi:glyoxylase-like metal-dependent hydrolase (beta-lactamase superfamily II)
MTSSVYSCNNHLSDEGNNMTAKVVVPGLYQLTNKNINAFILDGGENGLVLVDAGLPDQTELLEEDIRSIGREPSDLTSIVITHAHPDHLGCATHFSDGTRPISLHPADSAIAEAGVIHQTMVAGPGLLNGILFRVLMSSKSAKFSAFTPDIALRDGDVIDISGGLEVIHTPGHTAGHVSLLWKRDRGLLITGDAASNLMGLNFMMAYDDVPMGKASLSKLATRQFEAAVFGHGKPLLAGASDKFSAKFG